MSEHDVTLVNVSTVLPSQENEKPDVHLPLGCLYLISALERAGILVDFRDYQLFSRDKPYPLDLDCFQSFLAGCSPIVGISCMVSMLPFVLLGTRKFKESHPEHKVILGGPGPSGVAEVIVSSLPWIDIVVRGEGEATLVELIKALNNGGDLGAISGITYRDSSGIHHNQARPRLKNLDEVASPSYERINLSEYTRIPVITGRGCPFHCTFCDVGPLWENRTVFRSIENVMEELSLLKDKYGQNSVYVADDTFDLKRERTEAFCREIKRLGLNWSCLARVDLMDEALLEKMAGAGCDAVFLGIESGSNAVLKAINKEFTIQEATRKVEISTRYMARVITSFIWGFPFETMEDLKLTVFSVVSMSYLGARVGFKLLSPMPMSKLGIEYRDQLEFSEDLCSVFASLGNTAPGSISRRAEMPEEFKTFIKQYPDICAGFYYIKSDNIWEKADYVRKFSKKLGVSL
jgi:anaerobic magnesium-protoporphyrin IX monomethyl ester cyclase